MHFSIRSRLLGNSACMCRSTGCRVTGTHPSEWYRERIVCRDSMDFLNFLNPSGFCKTRIKGYEKQNSIPPRGNKRQKAADFTSLIGGPPPQIYIVHRDDDLFYFFIFLHYARLSPRKTSRHSARDYRRLYGRYHRIIR